MELKFDEKGLIPAIVQDHYTKEVLTLAYMNAETLALTIAEGRTVFWSRSRQEIWRKGDTSGNVQHVVSITADCDNDALVVEVVKDGPACHTGAESCFFTGETYTALKKQLSAPVWQAGPSFTTSTTSASASQSAVMDTTRCTLPLVSPLRQIS